MFPFILQDPWLPTTPEDFQLETAAVKKAIAAGGKGSCPILATLERVIVTPSGVIVGEIVRLQGRSG